MQKIMYNTHYGLEDFAIKGLKPITRRICNVPNDGRECYFIGWSDDHIAKFYLEDNDNRPYLIKSKYKVGEIVAIAQSYEAIDNEFPHAMIYSKLYDALKLDKSNGVDPLNQAGWNNKMFVKAELMPHQQKCISVRIERLQDISDDDCLKEGITYLDKLDKFYFERKDKDEGFYFNTPREAFASLIDKVGKKGTWNSNPFVFRYEFELIK